MDFGKKPSIGAIGACGRIRTYGPFLTAGFLDQFHNKKYKQKTVHPVKGEQSLRCD